MAVIEEIIEGPVAPTVVVIQDKTEETLEANKVVAQADPEGDVFFDSEEYPTEEFLALIKEAAEYKAKGNTYFGEAAYVRAIAEYENALMTCPLSLSKDRAVYFGNIAACHLKQNAYKEARDMCTQALTLDPKYTKALLRRAQANERIGSSTSLSESLDDYKTLKQQVKDTYTLGQCHRAERELPMKIKDKTEKEKEEMIGKLKDLGNSILGKFGLSTDNFQMQQDPSGGGGYSMNFVNK